MVNNVQTVAYKRTTQTHLLALFNTFGKNGTAWLDLSGASCDTERTGCEARICSCDQKCNGPGPVTGYGHMTGHMTKQSCGVHPSGCEALHERCLLIYHYYRWCMGLVGGLCVSLTKRPTAYYTTIRYIYFKSF